MFENGLGINDFVSNCIESHPELLSNKVCFIQITDGENGYDIELESSCHNIAGTYPTDTYDMIDIIAICDELTRELHQKKIRVVEDREEWESIEE